MPAIIPMFPTPPPFVHFPLIVESRAAESPDGVYAILTPASLDTTSITSNIELTWNEFNQAIHRGAHALNPLKSDGSRVTGRVVAILALTDTFVYHTITLAISRSGNIPFPISHRNSPLAVANLLNKSNCNHVILGGNASITSLMGSAQQELREMGRQPAEVIELPTLKELYPDFGKNTVDPALKSYPLPPEENLRLDSPRIYLHSSGSTSLPKAILLNEQYLRYMGRTYMIRQLATIDKLGVMMPPPFHHMGMLCQIMVPFYNFAPPVVLWAPNISTSGEALSATVPSPEILLDSLQRAGSKGAITVPSFMVAYSKDPKAMGFLKTLDCLFTGGAPLPEEAGDALTANGVKVTIGYGGTEFSNPALAFSTLRSSQEWMWIEFSPEAPIFLREHDNGHEVLFELILLAGPKWTPAVVNTETPHGRGYATSDLWRPHPTKKGLYRIVARLDDQLTLATGEKVNPDRIELILVRSPLVEAVTVFGRERNQIGILVQPVERHQFDPRDLKALAKFRNDIWSFVEQANHESPGFARIFKEAILPTTPGKPLARTPKGVVSQKNSLRLYEEEIGALYAEIDKARGGDDITGPVAWGVEQLKIWLGGLLTELLERAIDADQDIFNQGADSLTATFIRNRIIAALDKAQLSLHTRNIEQDIVYSHPSVSSLATYLANLLEPASSSADDSDPKEEHIANMNTLIERYTSNLPIISITPTFLPDSARETVLVTGTTGALGSLMLAQLLQSPLVEKVWAVNRSSKDGVSIVERQRDSFKDKALDVAHLDCALSDGRVAFIEAELSVPKLGLTSEVYDQIRSTTTLIIHNAWRLDFNLSVLSFEPHIRGARNLVDLALASPQAFNVRYIFISSVGALAGWKDASKAVPEEPIPDPHYSVGNGYGEGKYVTEKILETVTKRTGLSTTNIRVGQLSGTQGNGFWSTTDWIPLMTATSIHLGVLPEAIGNASWVPLDSAASAVLEVGLQRASASQQTVHLYHPRPTPWSNIASGLSHALTSSVPSLNCKQLPLITFGKWVAALEEKGKNASEEDLRQLPALKLLGFLRRLAAGDEGSRAVEANGVTEALGQPRLATDKMQGVSTTIRELSSLDADGDHPQRWIQYWQCKGLF